MVKSSASVADALERWRGNLIDLTRRNPLLALRASKSSVLRLSHPGPLAIWQRLVREGKACTFWLPPANEEEETAAAPAFFDVEKLQTKPGEIVCGDLQRRELLRALTGLYRRAGSEYRERGLHILHVAFGLLQWKDQDDVEVFRSPLVVVPVELARSSVREPFKVQTIDDEPQLNPALVARLQQNLDFALPIAPEDWDQADLAQYFASVENAILGLPGWKVENGCWLSLFGFFKGVMYRDLEANADLAAKHPMVRALAGEAVGDALAPQALPREEDLDACQLPAKTFTILDADASQRLCLEAAARGHSFVLHGPPGTGKSQTIANLIAQCLADGKKVLFVSEKMAALEVVFERLRAAGLGDYCLELHSHKANKRAVAQELKRCLEQRPQATDPTNNDDFDRLQKRGEQLTRYVQALHQLREPLQRSAWWALGEVIRCADMPTLSLRPKNDTEMHAVWLDEAKQSLKRAQELWHIWQQGRNYPWWGFKVSERYTLKLRDEVLAVLEKAKKLLERLIEAARQFGQCIGAAGSVAWLLRVGELLETNPRPPAAWLTAADLPQLAADLETCATLFQQRGQAREPISQRYGPDIWKAPEGSAARVEQAWRHAAALLAPGDDKGAGLINRQHQLRGWAADTQKRFPSWLAEAKTIEKWLAVSLPQGAGATAGDDPSPHAIKRLLRLAHLCMAENSPEKTWVVDPSACAAAKSMIEANQPAFASYHQGRAQILTIYNEQLFDLELDRIADGFAGPYQSWLRFFNIQFRRDRRAIARRTKADEAPATMAQDMFLARDLQREKARLEGEAEQASRRAILGRYEKGLSTDFDAAIRAVRVAEEAVSLGGDLGIDRLPERSVDALSAATPPPEKIRAGIKRLQDSVGAWSHATQDLHDLLPMDALPQVHQPLEECSLSSLQGYARNLQTSLNNIAGAADHVLSKAPSRPADAATLVADLRAVEKLQRQEAVLESENLKWAGRFGPAFQGVGTDWNALRRALAWTIRVREHFAAASPDWKSKSTQVKAASPATGQVGNDVPPAEFLRLVTNESPHQVSTKELRHACEQFQHALHSLEIRFEPPGPVVLGGGLESLGLEGRRKWLQERCDRVGELSDWIDWDQLGKRFEHLGIGEFWNELQTMGPRREDLVDIFLKAALSNWLDGVFKQEPALREFRRPEHERTLEDFRELDRKLLGANAQRVAAQAESRRPAMQDTTPGSETSLLLREAHKKTRHLSVRRLFEGIPQLLVQLKPCLLMSPLSVSQFLDPAKVQFDIVVFDEASQICPEDAISAILRGKQVIVTGDDQQLPPTDFFQPLADDDEDEDSSFEPANFESVLDASLGAGLRAHFLRWHYRSRREGLIAYSNCHFYENRLITFPEPMTGPGGIGVEFNWVSDGVYDRGGRRDNLREAQIVADLVFEHFRRHGETKTLGVIAFGQAQMFAIEDEIERRLVQQPELEPLLKADRLGGFFVKNLETVQGDERDVIVLSVGYGRDSAGKFNMHFGPLNREGGQRRLNVAVTRARERLILVSSIRAADLDLGAAKSAGVRHLHAYLDFAERGLTAMAPKLDGEAGGEDRKPASALEADLLQEVKKLGYDVVPQVGCGGYRVGLGVIDPLLPHRFLMGIECDGIPYHSTPTARDRDRLRQQVLEKLGWRLHRVWAFEWNQRRPQEVERLREALDLAIKHRPTASSSDGQSLAPVATGHIAPVAVKPERDARPTTSKATERAKSKP